MIMKWIIYTTYSLIPQWYSMMINDIFIGISIAVLRLMIWMALAWAKPLYLGSSFSPQPFTMAFDLEIHSLIAIAI